VAAFSPDGKLLVSGGGKDIQDPKTGEWKALAEVHVWDAGTWEKVVSLRGLSTRIVTLAFSPDGKTLAVGDSVSGTPGVVRLYSPRGAAPRKTLSVQRGGVAHLAFHPDGSLLVRTEDTGEVALWDPEKGARKNTPFDGHYGTTDGAACFGPEGK